MTAQHPQERLSERRVVAGLFHVPGQAERAVRELRAAGFDENDIGLATRDPAEREELDRDTGITPREPAEAIAKGTRGGFLDKIASWFKAERSDTLTEAFTRQGFSADEARYLDQGFQRGLILLTVRADGRAEEALAILRNTGADLGPAAAMAGATETPARGAAARGGTAAPAGAAALADLTEAQRIALREEHLRIAKEQVQAGEVRVRKEVVTEQQRIDVPVTREEAVIERHPVTGEAARAGNEGEEIRVPLTEEQVRVAKESVVKEEVTVGKRKVEDVQHVQDAVRHEEVRVETTGKVGPIDQGTPAPSRQTERRRRTDPSYRGEERRVAHA